MKQEMELFFWLIKDIIIVSILMIIIYQEHINYYFVYDSATTEAEVKMVDEKDYEGMDHYNVKYEYQVDGVTYHGKATLKDRVFVGYRLEIYYDKNNPEKSGLLTNVKSGGTLLILVTGGSVALGWFIWRVKKAQR